MAEAFADLPELADVNLPAGQAANGVVVGDDKGPSAMLFDKPMHTPEKEVAERGTATDGIMSPAGASGSARKATSDLIALALEAGYSNGVPRGARGEGPPFAPAGWSWRVGPRARINNKGWYIDSFRKHPQAQELGSKKAVAAFLSDRLKVPKENIEAIQNSYEWHIPASTEITKDIDDVEAAAAKRKSSGDGSPATASKRKRIPVNKDTEDWKTPSPAAKRVDLSEPAATDGADDPPVSLDEILAGPSKWPELAKRVQLMARHNKNHGHMDALEQEVRSRDLKQLQAQLLTSSDDVASAPLDTLPHSLMSVIALVATAGRVDDLKKKRRKISELASIIRDEVQRGGTGGSGESAEKRPKLKRKSAPGSPDGRAKISKGNADGGKGTPVADGGAGPTRTRKGVEGAAAKAQDAATMMRMVLDLKPTLSALSVSVDMDEPTDEEVDKAWAAVGEALLSPPAQGASVVPTPAPGTPTGPAQTAGPLVSGSGAAGASSSLASVLIVGPNTKQDREIQEYKLKLLKLERSKREWVQAFDEKLAQYRGHKEALEQLVAKRRAEQEAQRRKIGEEEAKLLHEHTTAIGDIQALEALIGLPDIAAAELAKPKPLWETSFGRKVQYAREEREAAWQEKWKELNEARKANLEQLKRKVEVYVKLNKAIPEVQIQAERERSNGEWEQLSGFLNEEKVELERGNARINELDAVARGSFIAYKTQLTRVDKEKSKLQAMLQEGVE